MYHDSLFIYHTKIQKQEKHSCVLYNDDKSMALNSKDVCWYSLPEVRTTITQIPLRSLESRTKGLTITQGKSSKNKMNGIERSM